MHEQRVLPVEGANPRAVYYPALDGIRAFAVCIVFLCHYAGFVVGGGGVDIFFVLSGFLITGLLFDQQDKPNRFRNFYMRRTLRIFPLFYAVWLTLLLLTPLVHVHWHAVNALWPLYLGNYIPLVVALHPGMTAEAYHILYLSRHGHPSLLFTGHFWSLCVEEQFYLLWPWVVFQVRSRRKLLWICFLIAVGSPLLRIAVLHTFRTLPTEVVALATPFRLDEFLIGGMAALLLRGPAASRLRAAGPVMLVCGGGLLLWSYAFYLRTDPSGWGLLDNKVWLLSCGISLFGITSLGLIVTSLNEQSWVGRIFQWRPLRELGKVSYGFYVFHDMPHMFYVEVAKRLKLPGLWFLLVPLAGTLALSFASFYLFERHFLRLKTRFVGDSTRSAGPIDDATSGAPPLPSATPAVSV